MERHLRNKVEGSQFYQDNTQSKRWLSKSNTSRFFWTARSQLSIARNIRYRCVARVAIFIAGDFSFAFRVPSRRVAPDATPPWKTYESDETSVLRRSRRFTMSMWNRRAETSKISSVLSTFTARLRQVRGPTVAEKRSSNNKTRGRTDNCIASTSRYAARTCPAKYKTDAWFLATMWFTIIRAMLFGSTVIFTKRRRSRVESYCLSNYQRVFMESYSIAIINIYYK